MQSSQGLPQTTPELNRKRSSKVFRFQKTVILVWNQILQQSLIDNFKPLKFGSATVFSVSSKQSLLSTSFTLTLVNQNHIRHSITQSHLAKLLREYGLPLPHVFRSARHQSHKSQLTEITTPTPEDIITRKLMRRQIDLADYVQHLPSKLSQLVNIQAGLQLYWSLRPHQAPLAPVIFHDQDDVLSDIQQPSYFNTGNLSEDLFPPMDSTPFHQHVAQPRIIQKSTQMIYEQSDSNE